MKNSRNDDRNEKGAPVGCFGFLWDWSEIDQNSLWPVLTLRAPSASKTLTRFVELPTAWFVARSTSHKYQ